MQLKVPRRGFAASHCGEACLAVSVFFYLQEAMPPLGGVAAGFLLSWAGEAELLRSAMRRAARSPQAHLIYSLDAPKA